jgi:hypothetical protein
MLVMPSISAVQSHLADENFKKINELEKENKILQLPNGIDLQSLLEFLQYFFPGIIGLVFGFLIGYFIEELFNV